MNHYFNCYKVKLSSIFNMKIRRWIFILSGGRRQPTWTVILILSFAILSCATSPLIETKRDYDEDKAMQFYLNEKKAIEPKFNSTLKQCSSPKGTVQLHWHLNRDGRASDVKIAQDTLNCLELNNLLITHLKTLEFPKPQPLDRVELEYVFKN